MADPIRTRDADEAGPTYAELLGLRTHAPLQVAERVREGFHYTTGRLEPAESDRLVRLARVFAQALTLFRCWRCRAPWWRARRSSC